MAHGLVAVPLVQTEPAGPAKAPRPRSKLFLGLDLGTRCGYAYAWHVPGRPVDLATLAMHMGIWDLSAGPYDSGAIRFARLRHFLSVLEPQVVFFEHVRNTVPDSVQKSRINLHALLSRAASTGELCGAFMATVGAWAEERDVPCEGITIQEIKRRATGKGNANKAEIVTACNTLFGTGFDVATCEQTGVDDAADAAFCCLIALERTWGGLSEHP